jgi:hypothetical protein
MTLDELKEYQQLKNNIRSLEIEKRSLYRPIHSPVSDGGSHSSSPGDPTVKAVKRIAEIDKLIDDKVGEYTDRIIAIEKWLDTLDNRELATIIRFHYLDDLSWKETAKNLYSKMTGDSCRMLVKRYFKNK